MMENNPDPIEKDNKNPLLSKEPKEIFKYIQNKFSDLKNNNFFSIKNIINIMIIPFLIYFFYYIFIKDDKSEDLNTLEKIISEEKKYYFYDVKPSELININNYNKDDNNRKNENLIIGIKFGNINSWYSYNFGKNISNIILKNQLSSELELNKYNKKGSKYSHKASVSLMNYKSDELEKIIFIRGFKTLLYENYNGTEEKALDNDNIIFYQYNNDNNEDKLNIIKEYFQFLKNEIIAEITKKNQKNFIKWVLAIPQNINQFEKQLIKNITTDLEMYNLDLIYESEAASLAMYYDKLIPESAKQKNQIFMLIDAGGYSIDITLYKIIDTNGGLKQLTQTQSLKLGILDISNKIINILKEIFGKDALNKIKKNEPGQWIKILNDIKKIIEYSNNINGIDIYKMDNYFGKNDGNFTFKNKTIKVNNININFPLSLSGQIIYENMDLINEKINDIIKYFNKEEKISIDNIIITGGLSRNRIFKEKIKSNFNNKTFDNIYYLSYGANPISKGAVIYGINPEKIETRISPITIGIRTNNHYNKNKNIELLIKKGEEIKNYLIKYIKPYSNEQNFIKINVYISKEEFNNLKEIEKNLAGRIIIKLKDNINEKIKLIIKYDTTINFYAFYENGEEAESFFEFYKF